MSISIIERPFTLNWSRNPIRYKFLTDSDVTQSGFAIEVNIQYKSINGNDFIDLATVPLIPDNKGYAAIDIKSYINSLLIYKIPDLSNNNVQEAATQVVIFQLSYREISDANPNAEFSTANLSACYALKGGISYLQWQGANYFLTYMPANKPFLTWQPSGRRCGHDELMYLAYLHISNSNEALNVQASVTYTDGTNTSGNTAASLATPQQYHLYQIPSGITQLGLNNLDNNKTIHYYDISVVTAGGNIVAGPYRYFVDARNFRNVIQFSYINSLGGIDSLRISGVQQQALKYNYDSVEQYVNEGYAENGQLSQPLLQQNNYEVRSWKGDIGYRMNPVERDTFREATINRKIWQPRNNKWIPVIITGTDHDLGKTTDMLWSFPIEFQYAWNEINFTPDGVEVGDIEGYDAPANLRVDSKSGTDYTLAWDGNAEVISYTLQIRSDQPGPDGNSYIDWRDYATTGNSNITEALAGWHTVQFRVRADYGNVISKYSNVLMVTP